MTYLQYLEPIFKRWELVLNINSPVFVKSVHISIKYEDAVKYDSYTILMGMTYLSIVMEDKQFCLDWKGVTESYSDLSSKERAEKAIAVTLKNLLIDEFEEKKYEDFWNRIDFDNEDWKRKEE